MAVYYQDDLVTLYHGSLFDVLPLLGAFDVCITDPPYGQTSLSWDQWPSGWADAVANHTSSLWCFGTMRMFLDRRDEFDSWRLAQDIVWDKVTASSFLTDRFRRRHEIATHWYRGRWEDVHHSLPKVPSDAVAGRATRPAYNPPSGTRVYGAKKEYSAWVNDGTRYLSSVLSVKREDHRGRINPTQKHPHIIRPLIQYSTPPSGTVLDPFAGSGAIGIAARDLGRQAVLIEAREDQCESAAKRLAETQTLFTEVQ